MEVIFDEWRRKIECGYCGSTLRVRPGDIKVELVKNNDPGRGYVMKSHKPKYFIICPICRKPIKLQDDFDGILPEKVMRFAEENNGVDIDKIKTIELDV